MGIIRAKKKKISFWATYKVPKKVKINFRTSTGKKVFFLATKKVPKKVKISFWATYTSKKVRKRR